MLGRKRGMGASLKVLEPEEEPEASFQPPPAVRRRVLGSLGSLGCEYRLDGSIQVLQCGRERSECVSQPGTYLEEFHL